MIYMWPSHGHFLTENNGYLLLTCCGQIESTQVLDFFLRFEKLEGVLYLMVSKTYWIILRARKRILSLNWGLWKINYRIITLIACYPIKIFQHKLMAIITGFSHFNCVLMANQCLFNGMRMHEWYLLQLPPECFLPNQFLAKSPSTFSKHRNLNVIYLCKIRPYRVNSITENG